MSRPCDYGMCSRSCIEWDTCTDPLPQLGPNAGDSASTRLPHIHEYSKYTMEDVTVCSCKCGYVRIVL